MQVVLTSCMCRARQWHYVAEAVAALRGKVPGRGVRVGPALRAEQRMGSEQQSCARPAVLLLPAGRG